MTMRWAVTVAIMALASPALAATSDGSCDPGANNPVAVVGRTVSSAARRETRRTWIKHIGDLFYTTDGVWGPDTSKMKKVKPSSLNACLTNVYKGYAKSYDVDVHWIEVDGRDLWDFSAFDTDVGGGFDDFRDASCKTVKIPDRPHPKLPLPHSEEPSSPVSTEKWLADLKDADRYPVQMSDTPVVTGADVPAKVAGKVADLAKKFSDDGYTWTVHKVRVDGRDSYLAYGDNDEGETEYMFTPGGQDISKKVLMLWQ
jgi:hypothetical protein